MPIKTRSMKSLFILTSALLFTTNVLAENDPLWMRYPAISPNGETIAFTYKGDIYTVPANGGKATQLTTHPAHDTRPVWSPDGSKIAFASDRNGNFDIFVMDKEGGQPEAADHPLRKRISGNVQRCETSPLLGCDPAGCERQPVPVRTIPADL